MAHMTRHGRRPARPLTGGKPASRKPLRQSRFGAPRVAVRDGGERSRRSMPPTCRAPRRAVLPRQDRCRWCDRPQGPRCRHGGERRQDQGRRSVARPSTCRAAALGPMPVVRAPDWDRKVLVTLRKGANALRAVVGRRDRAIGEEDEQVSPRALDRRLQLVPAAWVGWRSASGGIHRVPDCGREPGRLL
jgi:hypothetical protein